MDERTIDKAPSASLDMMALNKTVVNARSVVRKAKTHLINKLVRNVSDLKKKKGSESQKEKNLKKAQRFLEEIDSMRTLKDDKIFKYALANVSKFEDVAKSTVSPAARAMARLADHRLVKDYVQKFRDEQSDWRDLAAFMLMKQTGRKFKTAKQIEKAKAKKERKDVEKVNRAENIRASKLMTEVYTHGLFRDDEFQKAKETLESDSKGELNFLQKRRLRLAEEKKQKQKQKLEAAEKKKSKTNQHADKVKQKVPDDQSEEKDEAIDEDNDDDEMEVNSADGESESGDSEEESEGSDDDSEHLEIGHSNKISVKSDKTKRSSEKKIDSDDDDDDEEDEEDDEEEMEVSGDDSGNDDSEEESSESDGEDDEESQRKSASQEISKKGGSVESVKSKKDRKIDDVKVLKSKNSSDNTLDLNQNSKDTVEPLDSKKNSKKDKVEPLDSKKNSKKDKVEPLDSKNNSKKDTVEPLNSKKPVKRSKECVVKQLNIGSVGDAEENSDNAESEPESSQEEEKVQQSKRRKKEKNVPKFLTEEAPNPKKLPKDSFFEGGDVDSDSEENSDKEESGDDNKDSNDDDEEVIQGHRGKIKSLIYNGPGRGRGRGRGRDGEGANKFGGRGGKAGKKAFGRGGGGGGDGPFAFGTKEVMYKRRNQTLITGEGKTKLVTEKKEPESNLHPSWEASRKRKAEQSGGIKAFAGQRISFADD